MTAFITTVTEYHESDGRLVRVRCSRPQSWNIVAMRHFQSLVHRAAARCGWLDEGTSRPSRDSSLAALPVSTKLPGHAP